MSDDLIQELLQKNAAAFRENDKLRAEVERLRREEAEIYGEARREFAAEIARLRARDREAAEYVESVICMRTHFTGNPPYVGWKGLGLALSEVLDRRDETAAFLDRRADAIDGPFGPPSVTAAECRAMAEKLRK